ncbi:hypothetical protein B0H13DRAFT_2043511 [Mycena leptocephala]|nr:hypothetical protein B0H13DRAFT_2043511 [Mycena leptocephala]
MGGCDNEERAFGRDVRSVHAWEGSHKCPYPECGKAVSRHDNIGERKGGIQTGTVRRVERGSEAERIRHGRSGRSRREIPHNSLDNLMCTRRCPSVSTKTLGSIH